MTFDDLIVSPSFEALFRHEVCETAYRRFGDYAYLLTDPQWSIEVRDGQSFSGRFVVQLEFESGPHGAASGAFRLTLPEGMDGENAPGILANADLSVTLESGPLPVARSA